MCVNKVMINILVLIFLKNYLAAKIMKIYSDPENLIIMSVLDDFGMKNCIIVSCNFTEETDIIKTKMLSDRNIMTVVKNFDNLLEYLKQGSFVNVNTMIIVKEKNLLKLVELFLALQKVKFLNYVVKEFLQFVFFFFFRRTCNIELVISPGLFFWNIMKL